ncbi:MAG: arginine--tRNA ligase, partial [Actinobacteria bacterium]|nr:arginine--tRNA ligase [Actinomycetota bacterium]
FINFYLDSGWLHQALREILEKGPKFGKTSVGQGKKVLVEFVSANPTGPLVIVQARSGAVGDVLCNLFSWAGFQAHREFYVNDAGNQFQTLARTMEMRIRQQLGEDLELPEQAYPGEYVIDLARDFLAAEAAEGAEAAEAAEGKAVLDLTESEQLEKLGRYAVARIVDWQREVLDRYGVHFDRWFSEQHLRDEGWPEKVVEMLREKGHTYESEGALWFRSTDFGDDKDRVLIKSDGNYTYFVPDMAYHLNKFERGYDHVIDILGPDHHGYINRMRAAIQALGYPAERFEVLISQHVRLVRGGETVSMSKRAGQIYALGDLLDEVGKDASRFFFLMRSADSHLDFDLDLAKLQSNENPVFYVQYAHARISSILRQPGTEEYFGADFSLLTDESEYDLIRHLAGFPEEIAGAALAREPQRLTRYAAELAGLFHSFYNRCRVLSDDRKLTAARLGLVDATRTVLRSALGILGVSAPERM